MINDPNWKRGKTKHVKISDVLCSIFDSVIDAASSIGSHKISVSAKAYFESQNYPKSDIRQQLYYLKKRRLIKSVLKNNEHYYELTKRGKEALTWGMIGKRRENRTRWDKNFRIVMFDVPEDKKTIRDALRRKLESIGFLQMQKSVFIYPFDCKEDVDSICYHLSASKYVNYLVVKISEGEEDIIKKFLQKNILTLDDLKK